VPLHGRIVEQGGVLHQAQDLAQIGEGTPAAGKGERVADVAVDDLPALGFQACARLVMAPRTAYSARSRSRLRSLLVIMALRELLEGEVQDRGRRCAHRAEVDWKYGLASTPHHYTETRRFHGAGKHLVTAQYQTVQGS